jgi:predicted ribosomally synthesized peptide with nif11-like leader
VAKDQFSEFLAAVSANSELKAKADALVPGDFEAAIALAKNEGFDITSKDLLYSDDEILENSELESIAGGKGGAPCCRGSFKTATGAINTGRR